MKKYKYTALDYKSRICRSCYTVGRVYVYNGDKWQKRGFIKNDLLLCIKKSGDCHYGFVRIEKRTETSYSGVPEYQLFAYYKLFDKISCYGGMKEAFPNMETLSETDLVHVLYNEEVLIPLLATFSKDELKKWEEKISLQKRINESLIMPYK